jgi:hypothetical protein
MNALEIPISIKVAVSYRDPRVLSASLDMHNNYLIPSPTPNVIHPPEQRFKLQSRCLYEFEGTITRCLREVLA